MSKDRTYAPFQNTQWTLLLKARTEDGEVRREVQGRILSQYWMPVYSFLRRKGYNRQDAEDLTQGFFTEKVLDRVLIEKAEREKGKFRTFILTALNRYVSNEIRRNNAKKRRPEEGLVQLDGLEAWQEPAGPAEESPETAFSLAWARQLLDDAIEGTRAYFTDSDRGVFWEVFRKAVLEPMMNDSSPPSMQQLCEELEIEDVRKASNMNTTAKRCFRRMIRERIRQFVEDENGVESEIRDLIQNILSENPKNGAGNDPEQ